MKHTQTERFDDTLKWEDPVQKVNKRCEQTINKKQTNEQQRGTTRNKKKQKTEQKNIKNIQKKENKKKKRTNSLQKQVFTSNSNKIERQTTSCLIHFQKITLPFYSFCIVFVLYILLCRIFKKN